MQCETKGFEEPKAILTVPASDTYFHIYSGRVNDLAPFWLASERFKAVQDKTFVRKNMTIRIWGALTIIWWDSITTSWWYEDIRWRGKMMINVKTTTTVVAEVGLKDSAGLLDFTCNLSKWWGHHSSKPIANLDKYMLRQIHFRQIHLAIWTNTFWYLDKYMLIVIKTAPAKHLLGQ